MEGLEQRTITDLVAEDFVRASVLFYFGVKFYDYEEKTLTQVCKENGLNLTTVLNALESSEEQENNQDLRLMAYPVDLVIEYLKHTHYLFVKKRLPYIGQLIDGLESVSLKYSGLAGDLKSVFPLFVEDFIEHIYEEEDILFHYIQRLSRFLSGDIPASSIYYSMERNSIQEFAIDHGEHENEMDGLNKITNGYNYCDEADLHIKVLFEEMARLEKDLKTHARIEDTILFPKAIQLERMVKLKFHELIKLN